MDEQYDNELEQDEAPGSAGVMTKAELVDEVARVVQLTKKQAETLKSPSGEMAPTGHAATHSLHSTQGL